MKFRYIFATMNKLFNSSDELSIFIPRFETHKSDPSPTLPEGEGVKNKERRLIEPSFETE